MLSRAVSALAAALLAAPVACAPAERLPDSTNVGTRDSALWTGDRPAKSRVRGPESRVPSPGSRLVPETVPWDTTEIPTRVIPFTTVTAAPDTLWMGDTLVIPPPPAPEGTPSAIARDLRWMSSLPSVATVSGEGVVSPRTPGVAELVAWRRVGQTVTSVTVLPSVRGRVVAADGATVRTRVVASAGAWRDSAWTDDTGEFAFRPTALLDAPVTVRFEPADATHAPALLAGAPVDRVDDLDVVLLPARWRILAGSYAGTVVPIDPSVAHATAREALRLLRVARPGREGLPARGRAVGWMPSRFPLPLAFDRRAGAASIGPTDSAAFWGIARQLERDWGTPLFRPTTLAAGEDGFGGVVATVDPRIGSAGLTTTGWNGQGDLYDAVVAVRSRPLLADPAVVTHELLHALGVGHAPGSLTSVMHPVTDQWGSGRASAADVAYGQLLYAVRALTRPSRTAVGVAEAAAAAAVR